LREGKITSRDYDESTKHYHLYAQWIIQQQLSALAEKARAQGQLLYLDLPLGLHSDSYDVWRYRECFVPRMAGGAPPDPVFTRGQNWGFPPMNPEAMRLNRYEYLIQLLRNHFRFARLLRIDHVMGLHRLYWIPEELSGDKGVYVEYPAEELYAILSLESHRYQAGIIGENLGTVPPAVNRALSRHNIRQMYVVQYEIMGNPERPRLRPVPPRNVASLNTHDMPPFEAFLAGLDIDDRLDLGLLDEKTGRVECEQRAIMKRKLRSFRNAVQFLADSMADIVLVNMEDLWQETLPQNVPATNQETRPNWRRRMRPSIEQIRKMWRVAEVLTDVFAHRSRPVPV
jgi:4-alpha-glucanotransferase